MRVNFSKLFSVETDVDVFEELIGTIAKTTESTFALKGTSRKHKERLINFTYCELLLYTAHKVYNRAFTVDEMLLLFSGVHDSVIDVDVEQDTLIVHAHTLLSTYKDEWQRRNLILDYYFKQRDSIVKAAQLFKLEVTGKRVDGKISFNNDFKMYEGRIDKYEQLLSNKAFIQLISKIDENKNKKKVEDIVSLLLDKRVAQKSTYSIKDRVANAIQSIDNDFVAMLDKSTDNPYYLKVWKELNLEKINDVAAATSEKIVSMEHIAAPTGVGKSVLFDIYLKKLTEVGLKVLYVTDTHIPGSINSKIRLDGLGINTTIIMGNKREDHINKFIQGQVDLSIPQLIMKYPDLFDNLDYTCSRLDKPFKCKSCEVVPAATSSGKCGLYTMHKRIENSDVVITTPYNLLSSNTNIKIDKYNRPMYEILSVWADVIVFDEVDKLQEIADSIFVGEINIFSLEAAATSVNEHLEGYLQLLHNDIARHRAIQESTVKRFKRTIGDYDREVDVFQEMFFDEDICTGVIRGWIHEREFSIKGLIAEWCEEYVSTISLANGNTLDKAQINNRIHAILKYKMDDIRSIIITYILEEFVGANASISSIFDNVFKYFTEALKTVNPTQEELEELDLIAEGFELGTIRINYKRVEDKPIRNEKLTALLLLASIDQYLTDVQFYIKHVLDVAGNPESAYMQVISPCHNHLLGVEPLVNESEGFRLNQVGYKGYGIAKKLYMGIGREILFNNPRAVSRVYGTEPPFMFLTSATGTGTGSSLYTIKYPVTSLLKREDTSSSVNINCHMFYNKLGEPIAISGASRDLQANKLEELTTKVSLGILKDLLKETDGGVLIGTTSYANVRIILNTLRNNGIDAKGLYHNSMGIFNSKAHINKTDIEKEGTSTRVFVAVYEIISRGFNIVDGEGKSYYRDIIMMNRKLPNPNDSKEKVSYLHQYLLSNVAAATTYKQIKLDMFKTHTNLRRLKGYKSANASIKSCIAGNTFTLAKQLVGRGQRGGTTATLHLVDSAFYPKTAADLTATTIIDTKSTSIFRAWQDIVNVENEVVDYLYKDMKNGLNNYKLIRHLEEA